MFYFGAQNDTKIGPMKPIFNTLLKIAQIDMHTKTNVKPVDNFLENDQRRDFFINFGAQSGPTIGPLRPIFSTHLKVLAMSMWSNTDVKQVKTFWEKDQRPELWLILATKMAPKLGLWGPISTHRWKYLKWTCEAILMWNYWNLLRKWPKPRILTYFGVQMAQNGPLRPIFSHLWK